MKEEKSIHPKAGEASGRLTQDEAAAADLTGQLPPLTGVHKDTEIRGAKRRKLSTAEEVPPVAVDSKMGIQSEEGTSSLNLEDNAHPRPIANNNLLDSQTAGIAPQPLPRDPIVVDNRNVVDIDADFEDHLMCCRYAVDIYRNLRTIEVSEVYKLVPDTLYLTINLLDRFLSTNNITRDGLQLLGITCMLLASKFEEIYPPRVVDFCDITENTYPKEELLEMEIQVWRSSGYKIYGPTTKTFLRRFLRAAQASYTRPNIDLEYLANYLAELTLVEYHFLNFKPSMIAASAVFLARWTLNSSSHPWNPTLEHYASYEASDLRTTIFALQELQLNSNDCPLSAIRNKYRQDKFNHVAVLRSSEVLESLFRR